MSRNTVIAIVAVVVLIIGGWLLTRSSQQVPQTPQATDNPVTTTSVAPSTATSDAAMTAQKNLVKISSDGFTPKSITIKLGDTITWTNVDTENHTVNSDNHPTHLLYPFLNLGKILPGESKSVTPATAGTFTYHDHLNPSLTGSITVQ